MHIPLNNFENPDCAADSTVDRQQLLQVLARHPNCISFSGHSHTTEHHYFDHKSSDGQTTSHHHHVLTAFCGSWWGGPKDERGIPVADSRDGTPRGYHVLSVSGNAATTRFVPLTATAHPQMRVEPIVTADLIQASGSARLLVNVFDGGPRTSVVCEIETMGDTQFVELVRQKTADPYIERTFAEYGHLLKPWVSPASSSHIWAAMLPADACIGGAATLIRVYGECGQVNTFDLQIDTVQLLPTASASDTKLSQTYDMLIAI